MTSPTTKELLMRVIAVGSPKLFDGSDNEPIEVTDYQHEIYGSSESLYMEYRTRGGKTEYLKYGYFDLSALLETLDEWDRQHDDTRESDA
jgi:hypothetical protein|nr:MAG TPA: hypothetical protein [Caudoviricetes sp.]